MPVSPRPPLPRLACYRLVTLVLVALGCLGGNGTARAEEPARRLDEQERERLVATLRDALTEPPAEASPWVRIHAAEALLWHGDRELVAEVFAPTGDNLAGDNLAGDNLAGGLATDEPEVRIGVWRIRAQLADQPALRQERLEPIRQALRDPAGPDRVHAAEALAKLGASLTGEDRQAAEQLADSPDPAVAAYALWLLADAGETAARERLLGLLEAEDPIARLRAAFAIRNLQQPPTASERARVEAAAASEPNDSPAKVYLLGTAWLLTPRGGLAAGNEPAAESTAQEADLASQEADLASPGRSRNGWGDAVRAQLTSPATGDRYAAAMAIGDGGDWSDVDQLRPLLESDDADVRLAAAHAILRIDRRQSHRMVGLDWVVIGLYMLGMLLVGWYYSRQVVTTDDYMLGGRAMKPWAVGLSLFATLLSTITYLSWPGEIVMHGPMMLSSLLAFPLIAWVVGWGLIPYFMKMKVTSAYEILELRLGLSVRLLGSIFFLSLRLMWMAVIIYATISKVLVPLIGLDPSATPWLCALLGLITVIYTSLGGLRAVVFTDVVQTAILFGGAILVLIVITAEMGGVTGWWPTEWAPSWQEPKFGYDPSARVTLFGAVLATFTWFVCTSGSDQMAIQRYLATRDVRSARRMFNISLLTSCSVQLFLAILGFALFAYFREHRYILGDGQTVSSNPDQLFPQFIVLGLPAGISGLVVAGLLAAAMSSLSSGLNSSCSVVTVDFIDRFRKSSSEINHVRRARMISAIIGVVVVVLSSFVGIVQGNMLEIAYKVVNLLVAPLFGLFFMAMFVRWATPLGTITGAIVGLLVASGINYWQEITGTPGISFLWSMPLSFLAQIAVGMIVSLLPFGRRPETKPSDLLAD
ncbi:sodium:solute symporter family transporter [Candidatus Laterigemmans baculatus]|uniref:sodium:solute symporter family transporter n=1 Tax=Candidatus Laterigemmans baculatus TaxID=2770505 RepID=UPI0013D9B3E4|nr:sodium/solute symporter [Candidatus Laterigemmans baculatus]